MQLIYQASLFSFVFLEFLTAMCQFANDSSFMLSFHYFLSTRPLSFLHCSLFTSIVPMSCPYCFLIPFRSQISFIHFEQTYIVVRRGALAQR